MPNILLIRHGENEFVKTGKLAGRLPGVHLNDRGRQQSVELAEALIKAPIKAIYSSPMERASETITPLAEKKGLEIQYRDGLLEVDLGDWTGKELKGLSKLPEWKILQQTPSRFRFPNGETPIGCQARMVNEIESILRSHEDNETLICVSHADPIKLVISFYLGMHVDNFQRLACDTASLTFFHFSNNRNMLVAFNQRLPFGLIFPEKPKKEIRKSS